MARHVRGQSRPIYSELFSVLIFQKCERHGNLCENTVALPSPLGSEVPPCFTVPDLRDSPYQKAPYVNGPPFMRFYCGTPISTDKGYNIGSLWVLDNRLLPEFSLHQKQCFG